MGLLPVEIEHGGSTGMTRPTVLPALRRATERDAESICSLWHDSWHATHAPETHAEVVAFRDRAWFRQKSAELVSSAYVAARDGEIVGFAAWDHEMLTQLFVRPGEYGQGTANLLLAATEAAMVSEGVSRAYLYCRLANLRAIRFYLKRNWQKQEPVVESAGAGMPPSSMWRLDKTLSAEA
jgi:GNAT superfamily N-acetyltransferase